MAQFIVVIGSQRHATEGETLREGLETLGLEPDDYSVYDESGESVDLDEQPANWAVYKAVKTSGAGNG